MIDLLDAVGGEYHEGGKTITGGGNSLLIELETENAIKTEADAIAAADVDTRQWRVKKWRAKAYQQAQRRKIDGQQRTVVVTLHSVSLDLERRTPEHVVDTLDWLYDKFDGHEPEAPEKIDQDPNLEPTMMVAGVFDQHLALYAHKPEAGDDGDCSITESKLDHAIDVSIKRMGHQNVSKIIVPIGQDLFHADNWNDTTFKGTRLDVDTRGKRVFRIGCQMMYRIINRLRAVAPVEFVYSPGNHDTTVSWYLAEWLGAMFKNAEDVTKKDCDEPFSFHRFGESLVCINHGDAIPAKRLAGMIPVKARDLWAVTSYWEALTGHLHQRKATHFIGVDNHDGIIIRVCPSLSSTDYWHNSKGFNTSRKALDCYFYGEESGLVGTSTVGIKRG